MLPTQINRSTGFTLVEVLVISPIIILFIATFVALAVTLTGDSLQLRAKNVSAYDVQSALDDIENNVTQATSFLTTTSGNTYSPQGVNNDSTPFTNTNTGQYDALILQSAATTKNRTDPTREVIYTGTGSSCDTKNPLYTYITVYFLYTESNGTRTLYKRTILPQIAACATPWQLGSCNSSVMSSNPSLCRLQDEKLVENVTSLDVEYYQDAASSTTLSATQAGTASSVKLIITTSKTVGGRQVSYSSSMRASSVNTITADTQQTPPSNPAITFTRSASTPYLTTFNWDPVGNASGGYNIRYRVGTSTWSSVVNTSTPTYNVQASHRKQNVDIEVSVVSSTGTFLYGTLDTVIPNWNDCDYIPANGWVDFGGAYASLAYTKTSTGIVGLRGMTKSGTINTPICQLPDGFRPSQRLVFQVAGYEGTTSGAARVDINTDGTVVAVTGNNTWVSLSGITFVANGTGTWTNGTWLNGWTNWGAPHGDFKYWKDPLGRVHVQGLGRAGTLTSGTNMSTSLSAAGYPPSHMMHIVSRANANSAISFTTAGALATRGVGASYNSVDFTYYPSTFNSWNAIGLTNGWVNYNTATHPPAQCYKASDDLVIVRGLIKTGANGTSTTSLNSVGCGIASDGRQILPAWMSPNTVSRVDLLATGELNFFSSSATWTSIDNVRFIAD